MNNSHMTDMYKKYAELIANYCLSIHKGDTVYVATTHLAEPLLKELHAAILKSGGNPVYDIAFEERNKIFMEHAEQHQLEYVNPLFKEVMTNFDCYLRIMAPFNLREDHATDNEKAKIKRAAIAPYMRKYMERTGSLDMRRSLCLFPTNASAQEAGMSISEYRNFVFNACKLFDDDPIASWKEVGKFQQKIVDHLNQCSEVKYLGPNADITFSTKGRKWINSDGKSNMPSGEVFTAPVENSVNGWIKFSLPSIYMGHVVENVELQVKDGYIESWKASSGQEFLDDIFEIDGARRFGEAAIGTNDNITQITKNILFDEKIGGTIHMAVGQSYYHCGGKNDSAVHWDMITDMTNQAEILADGDVIYRNGEFII